MGEEGEDGEDKNISEQSTINSDIKIDNTEGSQLSEVKEDSGKESLEVTSTASQGLINYVGVEAPYVQTPGEQKIVVSYGDGTESVSEAKLVCEKFDGTNLEFDFCSIMHLKRKIQEYID